MIRVRNFILALSISLMSLVLAYPQPAAAALFDGSKGAACGGVVLSNTSQSCDSKSANTVNKLIKDGLNLLSFIAGLAAVIMIIVAGIKFVTSQGESANIASARNTIIYAVIGLVVVALSQFIVKFVLNKAT